MDSDSKIFVAGHNGLVGSAIVRNLEAKGFTNIITMSAYDLGTGCSEPRFDVDVILHGRSMKRV